MEGSGSKRTPSRCREWERQRRNKFNEAIAKLGEVVKAINRKNNPNQPLEDAQHPKIEIIEKAIICLTLCDEEKTKLKTEILALQVKIDSTTSKKASGKDASTQVFFGIPKKLKDSKYVKLVALKKKNKPKCVKEKSTPIEVKPKSVPQKLPKLVPRYVEKKGTENTIVVLPAAPYIFPQRPLLFPSAPPAIVLIDQNLQPLNKTSVPRKIISRNSGDITKTTMVNILPISAYSHPLSAMKNKKSNVKLKSEINKKIVKKPKANLNIVKDTIKATPQNNVINNNSTSNIENVNCNKDNSKNNKEVAKTDKTVEVDDKVPAKEKSSKEDIVQNADTSDKTSSKNKENEVPNTEDKSKCSNSVNKQEINPAVTIPTSIKNVDTDKNIQDTSTATQIINFKETVSVSKEKDKLATILPLESTLCDNVVDAGNARLELAEEFLATSPTAAFLMTFPLVSGNRADSPAEEHHHTTQSNTKDTHRRNELLPVPPPPVPYFEKPNGNDNKPKPMAKIPNPCNNANIVPVKHNEQQKCVQSIVTKQSNVSTIAKSSVTTTLTNVSIENPFLNLSMPSLISTTSTLPDTAFGLLEFDCNINKSMPNQSSNYVTSNNFFYKSDPFGTAKSTIYSTSSITSSHEFNGLGLYPCAMEKYAPKNKTDYTSIDDNLMKIGSSRLTYDIDLGWSHKGLDFVNCTTTTNTFNKDTILTTTSVPYTSSYNPFNPDFHATLVSSANKKDTISNKTSTSFVDTITSFYSQSANLWTEDVPFYSNTNMTKTTPSKHHAAQNYPISDHVQSSVNVKVNNNKHFESKMADTNVESGIKPSNNVMPIHQIPEKYTKKSPSKMHINWMTSETRSVQNNNCIPIPVTHTDSKATHKTSYNNSEHSTKKQEHNDGNYFPITMHNYPTQTVQEEFQVWPSTRPLGTTEISIDPPPINLPTLVGDLALGPHDKNKKIDMANRPTPQVDIQNCGNFLSVTQLMNRSTDNMATRYQIPNIDPSKSMPTKQNLNHFSNENNRKNMSHLDNHMPQPSYVFNDPKLMHSYDNMAQFSHSKSKSNSKTEKSSKAQKNNNYSTEALLRGANCTQKIPDNNNTKFNMPNQKYPDYSSTQDSAVAQVSHFPPILDYSDNTYVSQQFSGTTLYNSTTNTISNSFYSNFMPGSSNLMSGNYSSAPFTGDFLDYNQSAECNYTNHKYDELKIRNNVPVFQSEKVPSNFKSSRRESATKHKLECSKKESSKKYHSKKAKIASEVEDWNDQSHLLWQNKSSSKKHSNLMSEELPFPNYVGNQMPSQYQPDFFNSHLMSSNVQGMGHNMDRSLASFPVTSRANFNLSSIFPEITMKVQ